MIIARFGHSIKLVDHVFNIIPGLVSTWLFEKLVLSMIDVVVQNTVHLLNPVDVVYVQDIHPLHHFLVNAQVLILLVQGTLHVLVKLWVFEHLWVDLDCHQSLVKGIHA